MNILILGGDGFCGWATSLYLAKLGHTIKIVDDLSRREYDLMHLTNSLTPIESPEIRQEAARRKGYNLEYLSQRSISAGGASFYLSSLIDRHEIEAIVHFAEQRSAPASMLNDGARWNTVHRNVNATHAVCLAAKKNKTHIVHLGTMGVYGYGKLGAVTPEGYLDIVVQRDGTQAEILHPMYPGSIYHMTKCMDQLLFQFYAQNDGVPVTDLHQGIVWGTQTQETNGALINRFDYDGEYGTVLNRFIACAVAGHPLQVYGTGRQERAFIHISDTVRCIELALLNPPASGERPRIYNQAAEVQEVRTLAMLVRSVAQFRRANVFSKIGINYLKNPRKEAAANSLIIENNGLKNLGWQPRLLTGNALENELMLAKRFAGNLRPGVVTTKARW